MRYIEQPDKDHRYGLSCVGKTQYERFTGIGPKTEGTTAQHIGRVIQRSSWGARIAGGAAAAAVAYGFTLALVPPARESFMHVIEMLKGDDINDSTPAQYPNPLLEQGDIASPAEFRAEPAQADDNIVYNYVAGETPYLQP